MSSAIGNLEKDKTYQDDKDLLKSLVEAIEKLPDGVFLNVKLSGKGNSLSEVYSKSVIIDSFLVGYGNRRPFELDLVDKFNLYNLYNDLPKSIFIEHIIYSVFYIDKMVIDVNDGKVKIEIDSINDMKITIWN